MDMDKLLEAIQILIKEELKEQLPALIKEGVKAEMKKMLSETKVAQNQYQRVSQWLRLYWGMILLKNR